MEIKDCLPCSLIPHNLLDNINICHKILFVADLPTGTPAGASLHPVPQDVVISSVVYN